MSDGPDEVTVGVMVGAGCLVIVAFVIIVVLPIVLILGALTGA